MSMAAGICEFFIIISPEKIQLKDFITGDWTPPFLPFEKDLQFHRQMEQCRTAFVTQTSPHGVADAVGLAKDFVGNDPFVCIMPDCLLFSDESFAKQLLPTFERYRKSVVGTVLVTGAEVQRFGNVGLLRTQSLDGGCFLITSLSGKTPEPIKAGPGETIRKGFGGGIYLPEYFELLERTRPQAKGEVDDVPIHKMLVEQRKLLGVQLEGVAFDVGHPVGLRAAAHYVGRRRNGT
jgi:UTP--glucose-1-phosphate uridylyltransferase